MEVALSSLASTEERPKLFIQHAERGRGCLPMKSGRYGCWSGRQCLFSRLTFTSGVTQCEVGRDPEPTDPTDQHLVSRPCRCRHRPAPAPSRITKEGFSSQAVEGSIDPVRNAL